MELREDWREAYPGVLAAARFRDKAAEYIDRLEAAPDEVVEEIEEQGWVHDANLGGVPQPELDEVRSLFERAAEAIDAGAPADAVGLLEDVISYCTPED